MRIVSKQKDYYDCMQKYGQDLTTVYVRHLETEQFEESYGKKKPWPFHYIYNLYISEIIVKQYIVGFCGKIYPLITIQKEFLDVGKDGPEEPKIFFCYTTKDVDTSFRAIMKEKQYRNYDADMHHYRFKNTTKGRIYQFFEKCEENKESYSHMFEEKMCPIFVADRSRLCIDWNSLLRPFEFFRVFETNTAFQEIYMWISNQAIPQKPMPVINNEMKIATHGFDLKWSFRREPGK